MSRSRSQYTNLKPEVVEQNLGALEAAIFERLPDEGKVLGYHPLFMSTPHLLGQLNAEIPPEAQMKVYVLASRLQMLREFGYLTSVSTTLSGTISGYQRTPKAVEWLKRWSAGNTEGS